MWTLILIIFHDFSGSASVTSEHIDGFSTKVTCNQAAQAVQRDVDYNGPDREKVLYQCVKK